MTWNTIAVVVAVVGIIVSFFQWHVNQNYKRLNDQIKDAIGRQEKIEEALEILERRMEATRDEMHCDYVRDTQMETISKEMKRDMENVFQRLTGLSRAVSEVIGELRARHRYYGQPGSGDDGNVV